MANLQVEESMAALARERRTWREICALYPDEWVTLIRPERRLEEQHWLRLPEQPGPDYWRRQPR